MDTISSHAATSGSARMPEEGETGRAHRDTHSYTQILESSAIIGVASLVSILFGIVRTKVVALLLGPSGFGLLGLYSAIAELGKTISAMGINSSGVRQIAESNGSGDVARIAVTAGVLQRVALVLGVFWGLLLLLAARPISQLTFGTPDYWGQVSLLSIVVLLGNIAGAQGAVIQGTRRIGDLAKMTVLAALFGTAASILFIYLYREDGIVLSLIALAVLSTLMSWRYLWKVKLRKVTLSISQIREETAGLLKLGSAFMASSLMMVGSAYLVRIYLMQSLGLESVGYYQAAWTVGGLYVGFILSAMGTDFYPKLTAIADKNEMCNRLVNQQTQISLLLAGPGVLATLTFAPLLVHLFYSSEFSAADQILRWICLGMALRVITWPMGFIVLAKGESRTFVLIEVAWTVFYLAMTWVCVEFFGLVGSGIAFFLSYIFHGLLIFPIALKLTGFSWSQENSRIAMVFLLTATAVFVSFLYLPTLAAFVIGIGAVCVSSILSLRAILGLVAGDQLPPAIVRLVTVLRRFLPAASATR